MSSLDFWKVKGFQMLELDDMTPDLDDLVLPLPLAGPYRGDEPG